MLKLLRKKAAFTLMELMIAAAVLATACAGLLALYTVCFNLAEGSRSLTTAMHDAAKLTEGIRASNFSNIATINWTAWMSSEGGFDSLPDEVISVSFTGSNPIQVDITVSWSDKGRAKTEQISSLISQR